MTLADATRSNTVKQLDRRNRGNLECKYYAVFGSVFDANTHHVIMSYEEYKNLRHKAGIQQALHISELSEEDIKMIAESKMSPELDYLNEELKDE